MYTVLDEDVSFKFKFPSGIMSKRYETSFECFAAAEIFDNLLDRPVTMEVFRVVETKIKEVK